MPQPESNLPGNDGSALRPAAGVADESVALRLLEIARDLAIELQPYHRLTLRVDLDSSLDRDLGLDSLGRVELMLRLEQAFNVQLAERLLAEAETLRDLLGAVQGAGRAPSAAASAVSTPVLEAVEARPAAAGTLLEVLDWHVAHHPERPHVRLQGSGESADTVITYAALRDSAQAVADGLCACGLEAGQTVAIMLPTGSAFFSAFFGVLYAGGVPVPIYPPFRPSQLEVHLRRQAVILSNAEVRILVTTEEGRRIARLVRGLVGTIRNIETVDTLTAAKAPPSPAVCAPEDVALVQYTSGSTGDPKGVVLSHANLLANIRAMGEALAVSSSDIFVSWLPLYHDMGLIGAWLGSLYYAVPAVIMSPLSFLARPERWLWAIHHNRATLSAGPNFAYELCLRKIRDADIAGLDLSSWRMAVNGSEPVSPATVRDFTERFSRFGFRPEAMAPVYGLAECAVGLCFPPPGRTPLIDRVQRRTLADTGRAIAAAADDATALQFVACGRALSGHQTRIVDSSGHELEDRHEGRVQFRGPSATHGYLRNEDKNRELFFGDWLESGDLGYMVDGDIYLTGRSKDIIIRAGRNIYPHEVEEAIGNLPGIRRGCVVAFGSHDPGTGTERLIIVAETRATGAEERAVIKRQIDQLVASLLDAAANDVVLAPPRTVLKTSSGKIRRAACRALYESGRLGEHAPPVWLQAARLYLYGLVERVKRARTTVGAFVYAAYWWALLCAGGAVVWTLVATLPGQALRWRIVHSAARAFLYCAGIHCRQAGTEQLPACSAVLTANHSSYLDSVVLAALLPVRPTFMAKHELAKQFVAGTLLRRIGTLFVDRIDPEGSVESARAAVAAVRSGELLVFFPEGTLTRLPGLLSFHSGAFYVAAQAGCAVVPIVIRGTRSILRGDQWFPRRGEVHVDVAPPMMPTGSDWRAVMMLRDAVRGVMLRLVGEPDLAGEYVEIEPLESTQKNGNGKHTRP